MHEQAAFLYLSALNVRPAPDQARPGQRRSEWELWQQDLRLNTAQRGAEKTPAETNRVARLVCWWRRLKVHFRS